MKQAYTLSDYIGKMVKLYCDDCGRKYENSGSAMFNKYGDANMPHLRKVIAKEMECDVVVKETFYRQCRMTYDISENGPLAISDPTYTLDTLIGNIPDYVLLTAKCLTCEKMQRLDRWEIQRRLGQHTKLRAIMMRLKCSQCHHKGPRLLFSKMER
ncbi:hypothetical protein [Oryzifoliimicrobium ureilyticus]|uniref:hypothetical protein n=1 Tax=Oryzifoliimicrobium ureilyticus TaxID=3113724 RepID=UPI0030764330